MTNQEREQVALFRYGLIAPLLNQQVVSKQEYLAKDAAKFTRYRIMAVKISHPKPSSAG